MASPCDNHILIYLLVTAKIVDLEKQLGQKVAEVVKSRTEMSEIELKLDSLNIDLTEKNDKF